jgi:hypothetical protein
MNANRFWRRQKIKNATGRPRYIVYTDPGTTEEERLSRWLEKWRDDLPFFDNEGCGCCINIYKIDAPLQTLAELSPELLETCE